MYLEGRLLIYQILTVGLFAGSIHLADSTPRRLTAEEVIAQCQENAQRSVDELKIETRAGAVDSSGWHESHPCKFSYFEKACRQQMYKATYYKCVNNLKGR